VTLLSQCRINFEKFSCSSWFLLVKIKTALEKQLPFFN